MSIFKPKGSVPRPQPEEVENASTEIIDKLQVKQRALKHKSFLSRKGKNTENFIKKFNKPICIATFIVSYELR